MTKRKAVAADLWRQCAYSFYGGRCQRQCVEGHEVCGKHLNEKCVSCGEQAVTGCDYCGQFVCGAPLCRLCHGYNKPGPTGSWGFLNHSHRRRPDAPPIVKMVADDLTA